MRTEPLLQYIGTVFLWALLRVPFLPLLRALSRAGKKEEPDPYPEWRHASVRQCLQDAAVRTLQLCVLCGSLHCLWHGMNRELWLVLLLSALVGAPVLFLCNLLAREKAN